MRMHRAPPGLLRGAWCLVVALLLPARLPAAEVACRCRVVGDRALATIEIEGLVDAEMERLIRLGLTGRLRLEMELNRKRWLWVEQRVAERTVESEIRFSKEQDRFHVDGVGEKTKIDRLTIANLPLHLDGPPEADARHELTVRVLLQVVTADSLARAASWMVEGDKKKQPSSWLLRGLLAAVTRDLQRDAATTCRVASPPS